jgi:hypothetical protein
VAPVTQRDIPIQPGETMTTAALRVYAGLMGFCVTHTTDGAHARASLHYAGRAVDLADRAGPGWDSEQLLAINEQVITTLPLQLISELIYAGPGGICVKNGSVVSGLAVYGRATMDEHHNHVHLGVPSSFTYNGSQEVRKAMADDPNIPNLPDIMGFYPVVNTTTGEATGYYIIAKDGELHAFGPGARFYGRSEVVS